VSASPCPKESRVIDTANHEVYLFQGRLRNGTWRTEIRGVLWRTELRRAHSGLVTFPDSNSKLERGMKESH
jgi:hypothetical protein